MGTQGLRQPEEVIFVVSTLMLAYCIAGLVTFATVFVLSYRLSDERRPLVHRVALSMLAGAAWPFILLGLAELSSFVALSKVRETDAAEDDESQRLAVLV